MRKVVWLAFLAAAVLLVVSVHVSPGGLVAAAATAPPSGCFSDTSGAIVCGPNYVGPAPGWAAPSPMLSCVISAGACTVVITPAVSVTDCTASINGAQTGSNIMTVGVTPTSSPSASFILSAAQVTPTSTPTAKFHVVCK